MKKLKNEPVKMRSAPPPPEIIVKFREGGSLTEKEGFLIAEHLSLKKFYHTLESVKGAQVRPSFRMEEDRLRELKTQANRHLKRPIPSLELFVRVRLLEEVDIEKLVKELSDDPEIEYACLAAIPGPPPQTPDFTSQQDYQDPAPDGVEASYAWSSLSGDGTGVRICVCEYGFNHEHEDLPLVDIVSNRDHKLTKHSDHGTKDLGILVAVPDAKGVTGICYGASAMFASESGEYRTQCISDAISVLNPGDVLILEMQTSTQIPAEFDPDVHAAVTVAVGYGIVVVASAGNANTDLTTKIDGRGCYIWDPAIEEYDSGAIIVGGGGSTSNSDPCSKLYNSAYGGRVTCQGWGEDVVTTGGGFLYDGGPNARYTENYGGTSSATAIVAGVVACLQGAAIEAFSAPLTPETIRSLLEDPDNGTPQADSPSFLAVDYPIGPLPDMRRLLSAAGIYGDVYMRDNVCDTGAEPYMGGTLCWSPDIIARKKPVVNPSYDFGPTTWADSNLGEEIEVGQDNYLYVRMHNRGNAPDDVTVKIYWTHPAGFLHPGTWNMLGTLTVNNVLPGEYRVEGPIVWRKEELPPVGHYCLIGVINSELDPIHIPDEYSTVTEYLDFVRNHNNICYRNIKVEDVVLGAPVPPFFYLLHGLPGKAAHFRMEIRHLLPESAIVEIEVEKTIKRFKHMGKIGRKGGLLRQIAPKTIFQLKDQRPLIVDKIHLKQKGKVQVKIQIMMPKNSQPGEYLIYSDQYLGKAHLGRVNYMLRVKKAKQKKKNP